MNEFEIQRALDLPAPLPADERLLWIGAPKWTGIARNVFHVPALAVYFVAVIGAHALWVSANGAGWTEAALSAARLAPLGVIALCLFGILAWMMARTTCYAITDRRVIMRIGVALSLTMNIPLRWQRRLATDTWWSGQDGLPAPLAACASLAPEGPGADADRRAQGGTCGGHPRRRLADIVGSRPGQERAGCTCVKAA